MENVWLMQLKSFGSNNKEPPNLPRQPTDTNSFTFKSCSFYNKPKVKTKLDVSVLSDTNINNFNIITSVTNKSNDKGALVNN